MVRSILNARVEDDLLEWVRDYARARGVGVSTVLRAALRSFREDCEAGVPELNPGFSGFDPAISRFDPREDGEHGN